MAVRVLMEDSRSGRFSNSPGACGRQGPNDFRNLGSIVREEDLTARVEK